MSEVVMGCSIPDFQVSATGDKTVYLSDFLGKYVVLYFYPKDNTPGCTQEAQAFRDDIDKFTELNAILLGVSRDSVRVHEGFKIKHQLPFDLLSDGEEVLCQLFNVIAMKSMYGKQHKGIERSTFLISPEGVLLREWRKVKVKNHSEQVLQVLAQLTGV